MLLGLLIHALFYQVSIEANKENVRPAFNTLNSSRALTIQKHPLAQDWAILRSENDQHRQR